MFSIHSFILTGRYRSLLKNLYYTYLYITQASRPAGHSYYLYFIGLTASDLLLGGGGGECGGLMYSVLYCMWVTLGYTYVQGWLGGPQGLLLYTHRPHDMVWRDERVIGPCA